MYKQWCIQQFTRQNREANQSLVREDKLATKTVVPTNLVYEEVCEHQEVDWPNVFPLSFLASSSGLRQLCKKLETGMHTLVLTCVVPC